MDSVLRRFIVDHVSYHWGEHSLMGPREQWEDLFKRHPSFQSALIFRLAEGRVAFIVESYLDSEE